MAYHTIPAGDFFTYSPKIRIRRNPAVDDAVNKATIWIEQQADKGGRMNCQLHPSSDEERDGHLTRLMGVKKMHAMLLELEGKTDYKLMYHKMEKQWCAADDEHPCGMLALSDKWWMTSWDDCHLGRYGHQRREEQSCVPVQMKEEKWYTFSAQNCKYCNRGYDTISLA
ncbi:hypothetical protein yc1106_09528 [Curvularia clavata]|uniref:Uncharacterized protein n=1 Tax=Curvularia clavata TaxID=95742 RepID=A0A9Q9DXS8_CURCL|nr:hypothetical protein yc1106_09528 [Curvularia clavata]